MKSTLVKWASFQLTLLQYFTCSIFFPKCTLVGLSVFVGSYLAHSVCTQTLSRNQASIIFCHPSIYPSISPSLCLSRCFSVSHRAPWGVWSLSASSSLTFLLQLLLLRLQPVFLSLHFSPLLIHCCSLLVLLFSLTFFPSWRLIYYFVSLQKFPPLLRFTPQSRVKGFVTGAKMALIK